MRTSGMLSFCLAATLVAVSLSGCTEPPPLKTPTHSKVTLHPIFATRVTGASRRRPAIQVEILDEHEGPLTIAELYLSVQSSRSPSGTAVLFPLNRGTFAGIRSRYVQIPFEVDPGDVLLLNLLDEDALSDSEEKVLLKSCRATGYCVQVAGAIYGQQSWTSLIAPVASDAGELLGKAIIEQFDAHKFENFGTAEFIVPDALPDEPNDANTLTLLDNANYARVVLKIYAPANQLESGGAADELMPVGGATEM